MIQTETHPPRSGVPVREVLRVLGGLPDVLRTSALARFRDAAGSLDRWQRIDRGRMADALTYAEDALEGRDTAARRALRGVRRRLELEVWP